MALCAEKCSDAIRTFCESSAVDDSVLVLLLFLYGALLLFLYGALDHMLPFSLCGQLMVCAACRNMTNSYEEQLYGHVAISRYA